MKNEYTQQDLKIAYQIVEADLFNSLLDAKDGESIHLARLGKITKSERKQKCGWDNQTYTYYRLNFEPFSKLKQALNSQIIEKYSQNG